MHDLTLSRFDIQLYFKYEEAQELWIAIGGLPLIILGEATTLKDAYRLALEKLEASGKLKAVSAKKNIVRKIVKSDYFIEYSGDSYVCLYRTKKGDCFVVSYVYSETEIKLVEIKIPPHVIEKVLVILDCISIVLSGRDETEGNMNILKIGSFTNSTVFTWWSDDNKMQEEMNELVSFLKEIRDKNIPSTKAQNSN